MGVGIHEPGEDQTVAGVEDLAGWRHLEQLFGWTDGGDAPVGNRHGAVLDGLGVRFHRQNRAADDQLVPVGLFAHSDLQRSCVTSPFDWVRLFYLYHPFLFLFPFPFPIVPSLSLSGSLSNTRPPRLGRVGGKSEIRNPEFSRVDWRHSEFRIQNSEFDLTPTPLSGV